MVFIQTHSDWHTFPEAQIKKNLLLHKDIIKRHECDFFVFQEGFDNLPSTDLVNYFEYTSVQKDKVNFCITGVHEPRKNFLKENGWIISIQPGSIKAVIKAMEVAMKHNYDRAIYFDHDVQFFNDKVDALFTHNSGTCVNLSTFYKFPETAFICIAKDHFEKYYNLFLNHSKRPDADIVRDNMIMENLLVVTDYLKLKGDRYGDWGLPDTFDSSYDYVSQLPYWTYYTPTNTGWRKTLIRHELTYLWF
jgi:hypothetical protein